ncbi:hypothetical protein PIB30_010203 [Stylosanthes scabra]|uniref:Uncharacterized protein n=1 Tax=Stylosanthes scabra TaxID=79078 RepID=A0ABU6R6G6_9FABA|nr:hypothetical protein [Stylosanthes scabra]
MQSYSLNNNDYSDDTRGEPPPIFGASEIEDFNMEEISNVEVEDTVEDGENHNNDAGDKTENVLLD